MKSGKKSRKLFDVLSPEALQLYTTAHRLKLPRSHEAHPELSNHAYTYALRQNELRASLTREAAQRLLPAYRLLSDVQLKRLSNEVVGGLTAESSGRTIKLGLDVLDLVAALIEGRRQEAAL